MRILCGNPKLSSLHGREASKAAQHFVRSRLSSLKKWNAPSWGQCHPFLPTIPQMADHLHGLEQHRMCYMLVWVRSQTQDKWLTQVPINISEQTWPPVSPSIPQSPPATGYGWHLNLSPELSSTGAGLLFFCVSSRYTLVSYAGPFLPFTLLVSWWPTAPPFFTWSSSGSHRSGLSQRSLPLTNALPHIYSKRSPLPYPGEVMASFLFYFIFHSPSLVSLVKEQLESVSMEKQ